MPCFSALPAVVHLTWQLNAADTPIPLPNWKFSHNGNIRSFNVAQPSPTWKLLGWMAVVQNSPGGAVLDPGGSGSTPGFRSCTCAAAP